MQSSPRYAARPTDGAGPSSIFAPEHVPHPPRRQELENPFGVSPSRARARPFGQDQAEVMSAPRANQYHSSPYDQHVGRDSGRASSATAVNGDEPGTELQSANPAVASPYPTVGAQGAAISQSQLNDHYRFDGRNGSSSRTRPDEAEGKAGSSRTAGSSPAASSSLPASRRSSLPHLDLANYPSQQLLKVLASLLTQIATSNDQLRPENDQEERDRRRTARKSRRSPSADASASAKEAATATVETAAAQPLPSGGAVPKSITEQAITTAAQGALSAPSSTLCFHARNIPCISIEAYLLRILKYCPTTNDVFLSLLVYFDRMSKMAAGAAPGTSNDPQSPAGRAAGLPHASDELTDGAGATSEDATGQPPLERRPSATNETHEENAHVGMKGFVIDSYNVHRFVIAGVTVASKFFSDVFYTNSRYAKVSRRPSALVTAPQVCGT